jgi:hypothetical protein
MAGTIRLLEVGHDQIGVRVLADRAQSNRGMAQPDPAQVGAAAIEVTGLET